MENYDVSAIDPVSLGHNIDDLENERKELGGATAAFGFAAAKNGNKTVLGTKLSPADADVEERFANSGADQYGKESKTACSIKSQYFTPDKEKRACTSMGVCDGFKIGKLPYIDYMRRLLLKPKRLSQTTLWSAF